MAVHESFGEDAGDVSTDLSFLAILGLEACGDSDEVGVGDFDSADFGDGRVLSGSFGVSDEGRVSTSPNSYSHYFGVSPRSCEDSKDN